MFVFFLYKHKVSLIKFTAQRNQIKCSMEFIKQPPTIDHQTNISSQWLNFPKIVSGRLTNSGDHF